MQTSNGVKITIIYDNTVFRKDLQADWGFSALVEQENTPKILFDTGADGKILLDNMEKLEIDPEKIGFVFISHLHGDHTGGLPGILKIKPDLKVYKSESFSDSARIMDGAWTTGPLGDSVKEQSLIVSSGQGLIIITGCAHPGIVNIVKKAKEMFPGQTVHLVLGGFHLFRASDSELKKIINDFKELGVQKIAPSHCSGDRCRELFKKEYGDNFIENGVGKLLKFKILNK